MRKDSTTYAAVRPDWDRNDCSVRALATAAGVNYETASAAFSASGRRLRKGTEVSLSEELYESKLGMRRIGLAEGLRLEAFLEVARTGRFVLHRKNHAFAVVDGVVHDWEGTKTRESTVLLRVWKVTETAQLKLKRMEELVKELL